VSKTGELTAAGTESLWIWHEVANFGEPQTEELPFELKGTITKDAFEGTSMIGTQPRAVKATRQGGGGGGGSW
jgi:hypothetical protein